MCETGGKQTSRVLRAMLDTASDCNMISHNIVTTYLHMSDHIRVLDEKTAIPIKALKGEVTPYGEIEIWFYGEGTGPCLYFETFLVIDGDVPWDMIIGTKFLEEKGVYKRCGFVAIHPRMTEGGFSRFLELVLRSS